MSDFCERKPNKTDHCIDVVVSHCVAAISPSSCLLNDTVDGANLVADELHIQIHHNFSNIFNVSAYFVYHELADAATVLQNIRVDYFEVNETSASRAAHMISGNLGYVTHRPVLYSKIVNKFNADGSIRSRQLEFFDDNITFSGAEHSFKLPVVRANGDCEINRHTFDTINFRENSRLECNVVLSPETNETATLAVNTTAADQVNLTRICHRFQRNILSHLLDGLELDNPNATVFDKFNVRISEYGNPRNDTRQWAEMVVLNALNLELIIADKSPAEGSELTCRNMVLDVRYDFFYGLSIVRDNPNQAVIKLARLDFGPTVDLSFKIDEKSLRVPIFIDVMFFDFVKLHSAAGGLSASRLAVVAMVAAMSAIKIILPNL